MSGGESPEENPGAKSAGSVWAREGSDTGAQPLWSGTTPILAIGALCCLSFAVGDLVTGHWQETGPSFVWLLGATVLSLLGLGIRRWASPVLFALVIFATAVAALNSCLPLVGEVNASVLILAATVILLWTGLLLRPEVNAGLVVYAAAALVFFGADFVWSIQEATAQTTVVIPTTAAYLVVAWGIGTVLHLRDRLSRRRVQQNVDRLQRERADLVLRLERKAEELQESREQLMQAQKLKTVGTMASGLAHELNNILTPIRGLAELTAEGATPEQSMRYGQRILDSAVAASQITSALLTYTRQGTFQPVRSNARQLFQGQILPVLSKSLPANIRLRVDFARNVSIDVDRLLFQQCVANLIFNAVDAMPDGGEIFIGLATSSEPSADGELPEVGRRTLTDQKIERSAVITVADTGHGISDEHMDHIFDPFYTTKAVGSGTGLGLAMVQGTVQRHGGRVLVESLPGEGTVFTIVLPLAAREEKEMNSRWPVLRNEPRGPVVLVVTEDQDALDVFEELLESTECAPICTADARAANTLLIEMGDKVDLLVLDAELGDVDSIRMFRSVREICPDLPVILLSDAPTAPSIQRLLGSGPTRSVRKPLDPSLFATLLTDLLHPESDYVRDLRPKPLRDLG